MIKYKNIGLAIMAVLTLPGIWHGMMTIAYSNLSLPYSLAAILILMGSWVFGLLSIFDTFK